MLSSRAAFFILIVIVAAGWVTGQITDLLSVGVVGWLALIAIAWSVAITLARRIDWEADSRPPSSPETDVSDRVGNTTGRAGDVPAESVEPTRR